jgi:hypothetical protein
MESDYGSSAARRMDGSSALAVLSKHVVYSVPEVG